MYLIFVVAVMFQSLCFAADDKEYSLPSAEILSQRLNDAHFEHLNQKTQIAQALGGQTVYALGACNIIEDELDDYGTNCPEAMPMMNMRKRQLFNALLADQAPEVLQDLKKDGINI